MSLSSMYQLENLTISLLEAINDKNSDVQESVSESLVALGRKKAEFIFKVCHDFLNKNQVKLSDPHKASIFNTVEKIVKENISALDENLAQSWIEISTNEMIQTRDKENPIALQTAASNLLVAIGKRYVKEVFGQLQKNFVAGQLPHLFVINTMAYLAEINPYGVVPNLTGVLTAMLPMLGMAKADIYKVAFASALCKFSEAILYYCSNKEKAPDQSIEKSYFSTQIYAAFEIFFNHWVKTSDPKLRQTTIEALGYFANLIAHDKLDTDVPKIIPGILALYKKHAEPFVVSQSLYLTINAVITATPIVASMDTVFELLIKELFAQVVACLDQLTAKGLTPTAAVSLGKNQNELLRCFAELAKRYSDRILPFLLQKFEQTNEKNRIASLNVLRHLINSCGEQMTNKRQLVISGVRVILNETNPRVKKNLLQTIIAMAYHGYLGLEGGHLMIDFVMKQCALPDDNPNDKKQPIGEDCTNEHLRSSAESILTLFCTTVEDMHSILWPSLFEYLTHVEYSRAASILCKSLAHIAEAKRTINADDFTIKYESFINIPRQWDILARLIILCGVPLIGQRNRGLSALALMRNMAPNIDSLIVDLWDNAVPKLTANIEDKIENGKFMQKNWEDLIMKLLSTSLDQIASEEKLCEIAKALGRQIETLYTQNSEEKHFAFKCMGLILNKTLSKSTIDRQLDIVFNSVNHTNAHEREGCAISFGYTASAHLDSVLLKLETFSKNETKKSGGLFSSIMKDGSSKSGDPDHIKSTIVLAYGYVTYFAPKDLIISRLEANILRSVSGYAALNTKELVLRQSILKSLDTVTKCMHSDHLKKDFNFSYKNTILNQVMSYISSDNSKLLANDIKAGSFKICSNMVKLSPKPTEADLFQLIKISTDSFYPLQLPVETPKTADDKDKDKETSEQSAAKSTEELLHGNALYDQTSRALDDMLCTILDQDRSNAGLSGIFKHIEPWITSVNEWERLRSIKSLSRTLKHFLELCKKPKEADEKSSEGASSPSWSPLAEFTQFGHILGRVVSRCTDPSIPIRYLAIDCIESLLSILDASSAKGPSDTDKLESQLEQLVQSKNKLTKTDSTVLLSGVNELSKLICKHVPSGLQLVAFIERLIDGLLDVESHCSSASCLLLNYCVKLRGAELKDQVENLIRHLYTKLSLIQNPQAKLGTLRTIRVVFQQHLIDSLNVFLTFPIPCNNGELYSDKSILINEEVSQIESKHYIWLDHKFYNTMETIDICQSLCEDSQLISDILDFILQLWNRCLPFEEKSNVKYASLTPLIATSILNEIFSNNTTANTEQVFNRNFEKIFSAILVRTASTLSNVMPIPKSKDDSSADTSSKKDDSKNSAKTSIQNEYKKLEPCKISIDCFKSFIKCTQSFDLFEFYNNQKVWELLAQESTHVDGCSILAKGLCLHAEKNIPSILTNLALFLSAPYDCQKIAVTAFYAELMNHACCLPLIDTLMNSLLTKLIDSCALVRTLCIRGLGNMASLGTEPVQRNSTTILSAMMAGLDDKDDLSDDITHESMTSLAKIINLIDESNVRPILINILLRVRPCFEKDKAPIRASSYNLFGELARFGKGPSRDPFMEQVHSNFVGFVLHLNESDPNVRMACRRVLRQVGPLMDSKEVERMFNEALPENKTSLHYGEFINDLAKILVNEFPDKVSFYIMNSVSNFKSQWTEIRSNAVLFAGYLLGFLSKEKQSLLSKEHISNALIKLLKEDPSPLVRKKAAEAISLLSEF